jgi:PAS domain S-box-containing protein
LNKNGIFDAQRLAAIVEGSNDAIIGNTAEGIVTSWNMSATRIFGYAAREMVGQPISRIVPLDFQVEERGMLAKLRRGDRVDNFDTFRLAKNGCLIPVSVTMSLLRAAAGDVVGVSTIARDMSGREQVEKALRDANGAVRAARLEAEDANRAKTEFLAVMSHEIRTPMTSISGFVDLLTSAGKLTPQQSRYVDLAKTATAALLTIVDDILDFSKVEGGQLDLERQAFSPSSLIHDAAAIILPVASAKNLSLTCNIDREAPEWVTGDPTRLRQVLLNLLNNAVKFTEKGAITIDVRPQTSADGRERIRFSVADTGIGIPAGQQQRLFKTFSQADSSVSRRHGGIGLGLAICRRLVELMDGEIGVVSDADQGSTFWFTAHLPLASREEPRVSIKLAPEAAGGRKARILVVDDIDTNRELVEAYLWDGGYRVDTIDNAREAIRLLQKERYDLVLMDIQMPVMDGVTATRCIRALPNAVKDIPIIAMTGNVLPQQVRSFLDAGMNDHIGKPFDGAKLCNSVRRWLQSAEGREDSGAHNAPHVASTDHIKRSNPNSTRCALPL